MHRLVVLAIFATPLAASAQPSAVDIPAYLAHDREQLASHATAVCGCKTVACAKKPIDAFLDWEVDRTLMKGQPHYAAYLAAVAGDVELGLQRGILEDCNTALLMKPRVRGCKKRFATAANAFAREAKRVYAPYKMFDFRDSPEPGQEPAGTIAAVRVHPGRSWAFRAVVGPKSMASDFGIELDQIGDRWGPVPSERGVVAARRVGSVITVVEIQSERWADFMPEDHPLTKLFLAKMMAAGSRCMD
jgi:hypothetical protein